MNYREKHKQKKKIKEMRSRHSSRRYNWVDQKVRLGLLYAHIFKKGMEKSQLCKWQVHNIRKEPLIIKCA